MDIGLSFMVTGLCGPSLASLVYFDRNSFDLLWNKWNAIGLCLLSNQCIAMVAEDGDLKRAIYTA